MDSTSARGSGRLIRAKPIEQAVQQAHETTKHKNTKIQMVSVSWFRGFVLTERRYQDSTDSLPFSDDTPLAPVFS
jgi:hypothetical protein